MPRLSKTILNQYLRNKCDRQLILSLYKESERKSLGMPEEDKVRGQIGLLAVEGYKWQATVLSHLESTFGASFIIGKRRPGSSYDFDHEPLINLIKMAKPNSFIVEAKYEVDAPSQSFRKVLGITNISNYNGDVLTYSAVIPDLIQVFHSSDHRFNYYVKPDGSTSPLDKDDKRLQLRIIDIKLTSEPGANYFAEVAYYSMTLAGWLIDNELDDKFVVVPQAAIWPGSHQGSKLRKQMNEWKSKSYDPTIGEKLMAMEEDIEPIEFEVFSPLICRLLQEVIPQMLKKPDWKSLNWHVCYHCSSCDFLGYPWSISKAPSQELCWSIAQKTNDLSQIAYMSRGSGAILKNAGICNVTTLAERDATHIAFQSHHELRAHKTVFLSRAQSLVHNTSFVAPLSGTSVGMPKWADLKIYLFTEFDLSSGISFCFGLKAFWLEPQFTEGVKKNYQSFQPMVFFVGTRDINLEEQVFLDFLRTIKGILNWVSSQDDQDRNSGRRDTRSTMQFYLWDTVQEEHFMRVVGRHLDAILSVDELKDLVWLFPSDEILPNPDYSTRRSPITIVSEVIRQHIAAPIPHIYTLLKLVKTYHLPDDAGFLPTVNEYFQDPLNDLIPSERGHEVWSQKPPKLSPSSLKISFLGYVVVQKQFEDTVKQKIKALEIITKRLQSDLYARLSNQAAPGVQISSPARKVRGASWDSQLWFSFALLNAEMDNLEVQQIHAMPSHEREARYKSARLLSRLVDDKELEALTGINERFGINLSPSSNRFVYNMNEASKDVSIKPGDFMLAISPEDSSGLLDKRLRAVVYGSPLEGAYNQMISSKLMQEVLSVNVEAIDRDKCIIVLRFNNRNLEIINDLQRSHLLELDNDLILDPINRDFFTGKLRFALESIGNPAIAQSHPLVRRSLGMLNRPNAPVSPYSPAADFLWNAQNMHLTELHKDLSQAMKHLKENGNDLNASQWKALQAALNRRLSIIWGPPGTGKSRTLETLVLCAALEANLSKHQCLRILITAGTYTAIDNILLKVCTKISSLLPKDSYLIKRIRSTFQQGDQQIIRLGIDQQLDRYSPSIDLIRLKERLVSREGITIIGMTPEQTFNFLSLGGSRDEGIETQELFDIIILDEASQMDTAHSILPLCAMDSAGALILAGDDLQLSPIQKAEPPIGLENMVGSVYSFYKNHHNIKPLPLEINYRSNQTIVNFGIKAGYNLNLEAYSKDLKINYLSPLPEEKPKDWPSELFWAKEWNEFLDPEKKVICFVHDDIESSQSSEFESDSVSSLLWLLKDKNSRTDLKYGLQNELDEDGKNRPLSTEPYDYTKKEFWDMGIGIVTPHKAQMGRIISNLTHIFPEVPPDYIRNAVDTVERYQGQQRDIIIGSFAIGDPDVIKNEDEFLYDLNRFNVMVSRARAKVILFISQSVVDYLSNEIDTLRSSRLLKAYADAYCNHEKKMALAYFDKANSTAELKIRNGRFKYHV